MTHDETGIYSYSYTTSSSQTDGAWEAEVTTIVNNVTTKHSDYWELESSPAEVKINSMTDTTIPTITADVKITSEGSGAQEYQYEYCVVAEDSNSCGGGDDLDYASGAKLIQPSESWNTQLSLDEVNQTGKLWFKLLVYYGTEVSGASQSFTASEDSGDTGTGGGSPGGGGGITGEATEIICNPPYIRDGAECCLDANNNSICDIDEALPSEEEQGEEKEEEEKNERKFGDFIDIKVNKNYLLIGVGSLFLILLLIFILVKIFRHRGRSEKVKYLESKLKHLKELKSRKEISKSSYATERGRLLSRINKILKGKHLVLILGAMGLITLVSIMQRPIITGGVIGVEEHSLANISGWFILGLLAVLALIGILFVLIYILKELKKIVKNTEKPTRILNEKVDVPINEKTKFNTGSQVSKSSLVNLSELMNRGVVTDSGHYIGEIKEVVLGENKIDSLKIKLDKKQKFKVKGIIVKYKDVKSVGHVVIVDEKILEKLES
jgi:sporulation protein YlmC with PRC-barrel domain